MPLVSETKMADARKYSVSENHWPAEPRDQCLKLRPHLNFIQRKYYHSLIFTNSRQRPQNVFFSSVYLVYEFFSNLEKSICIETEKETNI